MKRVFLILLAALLAGYALSDRNPTDKDVIGTWKLTQDSLNLFTRDKFQTDPSHLYTITFRPDRTCTFASVSEELKGGTYTIVEGTWRLERNTIQMELHPEPNSTHIRHLNFKRDDRKQLKLWNYYGDPDQWKFIEYTRNAF